MTDRDRVPPAVAVVAGCVLAAAVLVACGTGRAGGDDGPDAAAGPALDWRLGGMTTVVDESARAFAFSARNFNHYEHQAFARGTEFFEAQVDTDGPDAAGAPPIDARSCADCHVDHGRAPAPAGDGPLPVGSVVRLSEPVSPYGSQLQRFAAEGGTPDATVTVTYVDEDGRYPDGTPYSLRRPSYAAADLAHGALPPAVALQVRVAPPLIGLGLLELIPPDELSDRADPDDVDEDGISGRLGTAVEGGAGTIGRFGWTATQPTVDAQVATALAEDLAVASSYPVVDCTTVSPCVDGGNALLDLDDDVFYDLVLYSRGLAVPARRDGDDPVVRAGARRFDALGCASCHVETWTTGTAEGVPQGLGNQRIHPYTDLLLHDLGPDLADRRVDGTEANREWRTAPLWGIGLTEVVSGHTTFLHDGRARSLEEAILWHGGEAGPAREAFTELDADERAELLAFLASL